jgi:hypothetical protein
VSVGSQTALKPSQTGYITFEVSNVGNNPVHVWKKISSIVDDGGLDGYPCLIAAASVGVSSEPECEEESAFGQVIDDISEVIIYDLSIAPGGTPLPPLIEDSGVPGVLDGTDQSLADRLDVWIYLGVMQPAGTMVVTQSYHLEAASYNEYQGDTSTFNIDMFASQVEGAAIDPCGSPLGIPPALGFELVCPP